MKKSTNHAKYENNDAVRKTLLRRFLKQLAEEVKLLNPQSIADAGCGEGFVLGQLTKEGVKATMSGVDLSPEAVKIAQSKFPSATFKVGSIYELPYKDSSYDLVSVSYTHLDVYKRQRSGLCRVVGDPSDYFDF